jgi:hypothetical protein
MAAARLTAAAIAAGSSGWTSLTAVQAPAWAARAASITELLSTMSPYPSDMPTGRTSSAVGTIATTGCLMTDKVLWPDAAAAHAACPLAWCPTVRLGRTQACCQACDWSSPKSGDSPERDNAGAIDRARA